MAMAFGGVILTVWYRPGRSWNVDSKFRMLTALAEMTNLSRRRLPKGRRHLRHWITVPRVK
jgi:hypothetical protein